ncbi:Nse1 non-SMC component of SMC5-6 complex-domain-containing protein [Morchella snyderi]|nr:Nse1 non-SMC component of SMC5-6 complex-domain-containing protein [Morchella snyderi]
MSLIREGYTDVNRAFLQAFMSHRVLKLNDIKPILLEILNADGGEHEAALEDITDRIIASYVTTANTAIHDYDLEIRSTLDQHDRSRIYALVNTASDDLMQLATTHSADEIAFFKRVLDYMFDTNNTPAAEIMAVSDFDALSLNKNPHATEGGTQSQSQAQSGFTKPQAEKALTAFVEEGWLEKSEAGWFSLTSRTLMELASYLTQTYNVAADESDSDEGGGTRSGAVVERIKQCYGCKEIITVGLRCQTRACNFRLHNSCANQYYRAQRGAQECPTCGSAWTGGDLVGEGAAARRRQSGAGPANRRQSGASSRRRSTLTQVRLAPRRVQEEEREDDEDMDAEGESDESVIG